MQRDTIAGMTTCSLGDCDGTANTRGMCTKHYQRLRKYGTTDAPPPRRNKWPSVEAKFVALIAQRNPDECWHWTGSVGTGGYPFLWVPGEKYYVMAHRYAYERANGPIPDGQVIDHVCHNRDASCNEGNFCLHRRCCNPRHLEAVTPVANVMRGHTRPAENVTKERCPRGHEYTNVTNYGARQCRICKKQLDRVRAAAFVARGLTAHGKPRKRVARGAMATPNPDGER